MGVCLGHRPSKFYATAIAILLMPEINTDSYCNGRWLAQTLVRNHIQYGTSLTNLKQVGRSYSRAEF